MTDSRTTEPDAPQPAPRPSVGARASGAPGGADPRGELASSPWRLALVVAITVLFGVMAGKGWLLIVAAITVMIFLHELGHYLTARWAGMKVTEFFLFFGPKIWSFRRGETEYGIKLIPVGAYVRIIGMNNLDECPPEDEPRTFRQQSYPKRLLVVSAGSLMHLLQAFVLFLVVFGWVGVPAYSEEAERLGGGYDDTEWSITEVAPRSAAERAGIEPGDRITSIDGEPVERFGDIGPLIEDRIGDTLTIVVERDGREVELEATIGRHPNAPDQALLGVVRDLPDLPPVTGNPVQALGLAADYTVDTVSGTVTSLARFFTGGIDDFAESVLAGGSRDEPEVSAPRGPARSGDRPVTDGDTNRLVSIYGVARLGADLSEDGMAGFLLLLAFVNVSIGVLNMIPLLPLDGGHAAVATYERIRSIGGRRHMADVSRLLPLTYAVFLFLVLIGVSSLYLDIVDPIGVG